MAAVASSPLGVEQARPSSPPPRVSQETWEAMRAREREAQRNPERFMPTPIESTAKFVFRTERGSVRGLKHYLPVRPDEGGDPTDAKVKFRQKRYDWWHRNDPPGFAALVERVRDAVGGNELNFRPILTRTECIYETDDADVAEYIRLLMGQRLGEFTHVYEQMPRSRYVVGEGDDAVAFPATPQGMQMAQTHMQRHGLETLRVVKDEE